MTLTRKLTEEESQSVREELTILEERIRMKIRRLCIQNKQLPYERLSEGRRLKELCLLALDYLGQERIVDVGLCIRELKMKGVEIKSWNKLVP